MSRMKQAVVQTDVIRNVQKTLGEDQINSKMKKLFGDLRYVDPEYADKTRVLLTGFMEKFVTHARNVITIITKDQNERKGHCPDTLKSTLKWLASFDEYEDLIQSRVHNWPKHPYFIKFAEFRELIVSIEKELGIKALIVDTDVKDRFIKWNVRKLLLLPTFDGKQCFNFANRRELLVNMYDDIVIMNIIIKNVIQRIIHPQYNWEEQFDINSKNFFALLSKVISETLEEMRDVWLEQLPTLYLDSIGYDAGKFDWNILISRFFNLGEEAKAKLAVEGVDILSNDSKIQKQARSIFGKQTIDMAAKMGQKAVKAMQEEKRR